MALHRPNPPQPTLAAALVLLGGLLLGAPPSAAQTACTGDCNVDAQVTVDELVAAVGTALGTVASALCTAADADRDGTVAVDELVQAVVHARTTCAPPLTQAATGVAGSSGDAVDAIEIIDFGYAAAQPGGGGGAVSAAERARPRGSQLPLCFIGGRVASSCIVLDDVTTFSATYRNCEDYDPFTDNTLFRSGSVELRIFGGNFCDASTLPPPGTSFVYVAKGFVDLVTNAFNQPVRRVVQDLTETFDASGIGCAGTNGVAQLNGSLSIFDAAAGRDVTFDYDVLHLVDSRGNQCQRRTVKNGTTRVTDRARGRHFVETAQEFAVAERADRDGNRFVTWDGFLFVGDCLGDVIFQTPEPIVIPPGAPCPVAGRLHIVLADQTRSDVYFTDAGGLAIDVGADGTIETTAARCDDPSLSECVLPPAATAEF
jgi:hypothetical protein